jgi:lipid-binding SYLF domain-containing protein
MRSTSLRSVAMAVVLAAGALSMTACTTTGSNTADAPRADSTTLNTRANAALERLYQTAPGSKELVQRAKGVLIFPSVIGGSFVLGVEHGRGVLRVGGRNRGEYSTTAASIGWTSS